MNRYGKMAMDHWRDAFPDRYRQIEDPDSFFTTLGQEVANQIADLETTLAQQETSTDSFMSNLGQARTAHAQAEEIVLAQRVWLTEELDANDHPPAGAAWTPTIEDPDDPWWQNQDRDR